jgi:hypothetical protein
MLNAVIENLINIGWAMLIFLSAYLANVAFSLWYNIKIQQQSFDKSKLIASALKVLTFVVGLTLLCVAITTLPLFATQVGWTIPDEYTDIFADLVIIGAVLLVSCKYIKEAFEKFTAILNSAKIEIKEDEGNE